MAESGIGPLRSKYWRNYKSELDELVAPETEWIGDEKMPPLYSNSLCDSFCSDSTIDLEGLEKNEPCPPSTDVGRPKFLTSPLDNNFTQEQTVKCPKTCETSAPSTDVDNNLSNTSMKSISMHDVSNVTPSQLGAKLATAVSCETIHSQSLSSTTKSKDSGFQRSVSCLSLSSGRRNYDHVESKVKAYIRNIKESEALRKKNKMLQKDEADVEPTSIENDMDTPLGKEDLILKIKELKHELHEKALFIDTQQRNYNSLLLKLAEAKNTIDNLRFQRISLNYSSVNESPKIKSRDIDFGDFEKEIQTKFTQNKFNKMLSKSDGEEKVFFEREKSPSSATPTRSFNNVFRPKNTSTPHKIQTNTKCLRPVSKIFSSCSRLDRDIIPLAKLNSLDNPSFSSCSSQAHKVSCHKCSPTDKLNCSTADDIISKIKTTVIKGNCKEALNQCKHNSLQIDLPNVDPFDKVKKWQASLPSIDLLETNSSSDGEDLLKGKKISESKLPKSEEKEISTALSLELMSKLKISEKLSPSSPIVKSKTVESIGAGIVTKKKPAVSGNNKYCNTNSKPFSPFNDEAQIISTSESESQKYLPKSSSWCCMSPRVTRRGSSESDDSSSMSSSVLDSNASSSSLSYSVKNSKSNMPLSKSVKPANNKTTKPKVVLREPKLTYEYLKNVSCSKNEKVLQERTIPKNINIDNPVNLKVESSQRKAWNARNNTNFDVCKEFYFRRSSSLQDCLSMMQTMVNQGSSIIESNLERSKSFCHL